MGVGASSAFRIHTRLYHHGAEGGAVTSRLRHHRTQLRPQTSLYTKYGPPHEAHILMSTMANEATPF